MIEVRKFRNGIVVRIITKVTINFRGEQWLKWSCEAGGSPDEARLEQTPYPFPK